MKNDVSLSFYLHIIYIGEGEHIFLHLLNGLTLFSVTCPINFIFIFLLNCLSSICNISLYVIGTNILTTKFIVHISSKVLFNFYFVRNWIHAPLFLHLKIRLNISSNLWVSYIKDFYNTFKLHIFHKFS